MTDADRARVSCDLPIAIAHDYLTQRGGAERVVLALLAAFPDASTHVALYEPSATYPGFAGRDIRPLAIDRLGPVRRNHRLSLPLMAPAFSSRRVEAPAVLCSSSGWAHGIRTESPKVVYCHSPARWLYRHEGYLRHFGRAARVGLGVMRRRLIGWDQTAMASADRILVNSNTIAAEVREVYGRDSEVVPPASTLDPAGDAEPVPGLASGFWLTVSRLLGYKRLDVLLAVARRRPDERFAIVGDGPLGGELADVSPSNVTWLGSVTDQQLRWLYANCSALVGTSEEDFGLTPVEAAGFGRPAVVPRARGYLDHVVEGRTGIFHDGTAGGLDDALGAVLEERWDEAALCDHAERYHPGVFSARVIDIIEDLT
jgi:glycosyltransferase involved in cell wall biosynthesis